MYLAIRGGIRVASFTIDTCIWVSSVKGGLSRGQGYINQVGIPQTTLYFQPLGWQEAQTEHSFIGFRQGLR